MVENHLTKEDGAAEATDEKTKMAALRAALIKGEESGDLVPFDVDEFIAARKSNPHG